MGNFDFNMDNFLADLLITIIVYMIIPLVLRLVKNKAYTSKEATKIAIINSVVIGIIVFTILLLLGHYEDNKVNFMPPLFYYGINYLVLISNLKPRDYTYVFLISSFTCCICSWFAFTLIFGIAAFIFAIGGLSIAKTKGSVQRIVLYIEAFLSLFILFYYLHLSVFKLGNELIWGVISALMCMIILYFVVFDKQTLVVKKKEETIDDNNIEKFDLDNFDNKDFDTQENSNLYKATYCKVCGGKLNQNKKCNKCGKQYFKFSYKVLSCILIFVILILSGVCFHFYRLYKETWEVAESYFEEAINVGMELDELNGYRTTQWTKEKLDFFDENIAFVIEGYGKYYYTYDCMVDITTGGEYSYWAYNKEQAISRGYTKGSC